MIRIFIFLLCVLNLYAENILLLSKYNDNFFDNKNTQEYLMSEKLDGVRGIWDGKNLKTRKGNIIRTPRYFIQNFPPFALDGELWIKRNSFDEISALVRSNDDKNILWKNVTYNVFDVPNACKEFNIKCTLENRLNILKQYLLKNKNQYIKIIPQIKIQNKKHLQEFYNELIKNKAEGIVIRKNDLEYENKRSKNALKYKPFEDSECEVIGYTQGKYENQIASLLCKTIINNEEKIIKISSGLMQKDRLNPPKIGSVITYKFSGYTKNNLPKFPSFLRVRYEK